MKIFWTTLNPRFRALTVFIVGVIISLISFGAAGGSVEFVDLIFAVYFAALMVYFLLRWGFFSAYVSLALPNHETATYEKMRKNRGRKRHGPASEPEFIDADEASEELLPDDRVIGIFHNGEAAAYPLASLATRETSNEEFGDTPVVVSWSPVTYSARAFIARAGSSPTLNLGRHTHTVFNSPLMPNNDGSGFIQFTGQAVVGELAGWTLEPIPVITTTWAAWKLAYPDTEVMSTEGGPDFDVFERYYASDQNGIHSLNPTDKRLHGKDVVLGLNINGEAKAYSYPGLIEQPLIEETLGRTPVLVLQERSSATAAAFSRTVKGRTLTFKGQTKNPRRRSPEATASGEGERGDYEPWLIEDTQTNSTWRAISGECIEGEMKGDRMEMLPAMTGFWFAWSRFYPDTELFGAIGEIPE